jgi:DNA (cytosine-5)-methyltransferase 1
VSTIQAADLFCGAGGTSTGLMMAAAELGRPVNLLAVNHWPTAVNTHTLNHPGVRHLCETLDAVDPRKVVPGGKLELLVASPECTHHSNARGGKPMSDQSRATAWHIPRWADALRIDNILIENVREFADWGPIGDDGRPVPEARGKLFIKLLETLDCMGYTVGHRILNSAHFGGATSRQRLFVQARKKGAIVWPSPSHMAPADMSAYPGMMPWRTAREIIDWDLPGKSIYHRARPLAPKTLQRIRAGLQKFCGIPFIIPTTHSGGAERCHDMGAPVPTVTTAHRGEMALIEPFLVVFQNNRDGYSVEKPLPTVLTSPGHFGLCEPFIVGAGGPSGQGHPQSLDAPLGTVLAGNNRALIEPYLCEFHGGENGKNRNRSVDEPLPTQDCSNRFGLAQPYLIKFYGTGEGAASVDAPLGTITSKDRFGLVEPHLLTSDMTPVARLDIRFRMLQPHELAAAMGFPKEYQFTGNREDQVRQIGNSVEVRTAKSLCKAILGDAI